MAEPLNKTPLPPPDSSTAAAKSGTRPPGSGRSAWAIAVSLIQAGVILPIATVAGWAIGSALDQRFHQRWISIAGLLFGAVAGFLEIFRAIFALNRSEDGQ